jgi:hypothetical protein
MSIFRSTGREKSVSSGLTKKKEKILILNFFVPPARHYCERLSRERCIVNKTNESLGLKVHGQTKSQAQDGVEKEIVCRESHIQKSI